MTRSPFGYVHFTAAACLLFSAISMAGDGCPSETVQGWRVVSDATCPIGKGLWGREPSSTQNRFWVQCGLLTSLPEPWFEKALLKGVSMDSSVAFKKEPNQYRCLAGPYSNYEQAAKVRDALRQQKPTATAFIREIDKSEPALPTKTAHQKTMKANVGIQKSKASPKFTASRRFQEIGEAFNPAPNKNASYFTYQGMQWWKATREEARSACVSGGKQLVSEETLAKLATKPLTRDKLPAVTRYWIDDGKALDLLLMIPMPVSRHAQLLVLCE